MSQTLARTHSRTRRLHFSLIIFLVCLLFTFLIWDHYLNSRSELDRNVISTLILIMGTLFSAAAGLLTMTLESARSKLEKEVNRRTEELKTQNGELQRAFQEIKVLKGYIPICAWCKKIRNDDGRWQPIEVYFHEQTQARLSHGLCEECRQVHFPQTIRPA